VITLNTHTNTHTQLSSRIQVMLCAPSVIVKTAVPAKRDCVTAPSELHLHRQYGQSGSDTKAAGIDLLLLNMMYLLNLK